RGVRIATAGGGAGLVAGARAVAELDACRLDGCGVVVGSQAQVAAHGTEVAGPAGDGILVLGGGMLVAERCRVHGAAGAGIQGQPAGRAEVTASEVSGNAGDGIRCDSQDAVLLRDCDVRDNGDQRQSAVDTAAEHGPAAGQGVGPLAELDSLVGLASVK